MSLPVEHLSTLAAIMRTGSFEAAARELRVTPSAVSQRVSALERRVGTVLLIRGRPVETTPAGATLLRTAKQLEQIVDDAERELASSESTSRAPIPIAANADSLATWFTAAVARAARELEAQFEVTRADEAYSLGHLRRGDVMAALTAKRAPVPGCVSTRIGMHRYHAVASPGFFDDHFAEGLTSGAFREAPMMEFDREDSFQRRFLARVGHRDIDPPRNYIPSSMEFAQAIELGMGWGLLPEQQCEAGLESGALVDVAPGQTVDLPVYWQRWRLDSPVLDELTEIVLEEGSAALARRSPTPSRNR